MARGRARRATSRSSRRTSRKSCNLVRDKAALLGQALNLDPYDALRRRVQPRHDHRRDRRDVHHARPPPARPDPGSDRRCRRSVRRWRSPASSRPPSSAQLAVEVMKAIGFPFDRGRLDESEHPFTEGVPGDIRITTRFRSHRSAHRPAGRAARDRSRDVRPRPAAGVARPAGRARPRHGAAGEPVAADGDARSAAAGRSCATSSRCWRSTSASPGPEWEVENLYRLLTRVRRSLIRVDADEVTYPVHIMLRYELEKRDPHGRARGQGPARRLERAAWSDRLGVRPANDAEGCLQDVHWAVGSFGYFPSYALGAVIAGQLYESLRADVPELDEQIARGRVRRPVRLAAQNVHAIGGEGQHAGADRRRHRQAAVGRRVAALRRRKYLEDAEQRCMSRSPARCRPPDLRTTFKRLQAHLRGLVGKAIEDFRMIDAGRPRDGVPVRRQGFVHAARHAAVAAAQRAGATSS